MKAVLISIQPKWCEKIINGKKTVEVRKNRPKLETPFKCYIYCTQGQKTDALLVGEGQAKLMVCSDHTKAIPFGGSIGNGKVIAEFTCNGIHEDQYYNEKTWELLDSACMDINDMSQYLAGKETAYFWNISDLIIYEKPRALFFRRPCSNDEFCEGCAMYCENLNCCGNAALYLRRAPQSWCYVEVDER